MLNSRSERTAVPPAPPASPDAVGAAGVAQPGLHARQPLQQLAQAPGETVAGPTQARVLGPTAIVMGLPEGLTRLRQDVLLLGAAGRRLQQFDHAIQFGGRQSVAAQGGDHFGLVAGRQPHQ